MADLMEQVRSIVCRVGKLGPLGPDEDYYHAGLTSDAALALLLALEAECGVGIPDDRFVAARTVRDLCAVVAGQQKDRAA